ncbi:MAG: hypothetical protein U0Q55_17925 [Vicinamibacterales bacterium]
MRMREPTSACVARAGRRALQIVLLALLGLGASAGPAGAAPDEVIDRVLAVVSGEVITLSDVRAARELGRVTVTDAGDPVRAVLSQLIDRALVLDEVNRFAPPEPAAATIDESLDGVVARADSPAAFEAMLVRLGIDRAFVRDLLREDLRIRAYLNQRFTADTIEQQRAMVNDWVAGLRRRADIVDLYRK